VNREKPSDERAVARDRSQQAKRVSSERSRRAGCLTITLAVDGDSRHGPRYGEPLDQQTLWGSFYALLRAQEEITPDALEDKLVEARRRLSLWSDPSECSKEQRERLGYGSRYKQPLDQETLRDVVAVMDEAVQRVGAHSRAGQELVSAITQLSKWRDADSA
jgi:hypothetical protein